MSNLPTIFNGQTDQFLEDLSMIFKIVTGMGMKKYVKVNDIEVNSFKDMYRYLDHDQLLAVVVLITFNTQFDRSVAAKPLRKYLLARRFIEFFPELIDEEEGRMYLEELSKKITPEMLVY